MFNDYKKKRLYDNPNMESESCTYVLTEKHVLERPLAFAYQMDSVLPELFDKVLVLAFIIPGCYKNRILSIFLLFSFRTHSIFFSRFINCVYQQFLINCVLRFQLVCVSLKKNMSVENNPYFGVFIKKGCHMQK